MRGRVPQQREGHQLRAGGDGLRRGSRSQGRVSGQSGHSLAARSKRREKVVRFEGQEAAFTRKRK